MAKRREPTPLRLVPRAPSAQEHERDPDETEPAPCCHGHFPEIPFRHPPAVGAAYRAAPVRVHEDGRRRGYRGHLREDELAALEEVPFEAAAHALIDGVTRGP